MDFRTIPKPTQDAAGEDCRPGKPLLLLVELVAAAAEPTLREFAASSGCRIFEAPSDARPGSLVISGSPEGFAALRGRLLGLKSLTFVREAVEDLLRSAASAVGLEPRPAETVQRSTVSAEVAVPPGTTLLVTREVSFDAAHNLPRYKGKCERLHGHTYRVQVTVKAALDTWSGMAFDFHDLKKALETRVVQVLDHAYVNEIIPNPSAEYIAIWIWDRLSDLPLHEVKVWETPTCLVTYQGPPGPRSS